MCTLLEIVWGFGGDFRVRRDYHIEGERTIVEMQLFQALFLFRYMLNRGVILRNSTMDVKVLEDPTMHNQRTAECLFGRHWYSTLVDLLTTRREDRETHAWLWDASRLFDGSRRSDSQRVKLEICKIPVSLLQFFRAHAKGTKPVHSSCWGDWHFAVLAGSENGRLAERLINHFMSSHKVREMAFAGAIVPTVEYFYHTVGTGGASWPRYAERRCLDLAERPEIDQPTTTYNDLYKEFFPTARSRSGIFDYRHCMHELHGVLEFVRNMPTGIEITEKEAITLKERIKDACDSIVALRNRELIVH